MNAKPIETLYNGYRSALPGGGAGAGTFRTAKVDFGGGTWYNRIRGSEADDPCH